MKATQLCALAVFCLGLITGCSSTAHSAGSAYARVRAVEGSAEVSRGNGSWEPAHLWQKLRSGDRARTGSNGKIDLSLGKFGGVLTLMPDSAIEVEQLGATSADSRIVAVINLPEGRVVGDTLKLPGNKRIQIKTRNGTHEIP